MFSQYIQSMWLLEVFNFKLTFFPEFFLFDRGKQIQLNKKSMAYVIIMLSILINLYLWKSVLSLKIKYRRNPDEKKFIQKKIVCEKKYKATSLWSI